MNYLVIYRESDGGSKKERGREKYKWRDRKACTELQNVAWVFETGFVLFSFLSHKGQKDY